MKCGVGDYTGKLANALVRCPNTKVAVLTASTAIPVPAEFEFEVFPVARGWRLWDVGRIASVVRAWRPDLVHIQYPTQGYGRSYLPWLLPTLLRTLRFPLVQTWHEHNFEKAKRNILNAFLRGGLVAVRPDYQAKMPAWYRRLNRKKLFRFIPNASAIPTVVLTNAERANEKSRFTSESKNLIAYFGFVHADKRVELLLDIADPSTDHLLLVCDLDQKDGYNGKILHRIHERPWAGKVTVTGFVPAAQVGRLLAAADAVVLPFRSGGGEWNTSIRAAALQGTFVLTTSSERHGYDATQNIYFAVPDDVPDMRRGLQGFIGRRIAPSNNQIAEWDAIAAAHKSLYQAVLCAS